MAPRTETSTSTEMPDRPNILQAFHAAKAQHSAATDETTETDTDTDEADAADGEATGDEGTDDGDEHALDTEASTGDDDDEAGTSPTQTRPAGRASASTATRKTAAGDETGELLTDEEFTALQEKHKDDPVALRKALQGVFTRKTQAVAQERTRQERFEKYADIIDAYEVDPTATIRALAADAGLKFVDDQAAPTEEERNTAAAAEAEQTLTEFKTALGPELEYLAEPLLPAITKLAERIAGKVIETKTGPLVQQTKELAGQRVIETTDKILTAFGDTRPDWKDHEDRMFELSQQLQPAKGMSELEYLDHLYTLATLPQSKAETEKQVAARVKKALKEMETGAERSERRARAVPETTVTVGPPEGRAPTFREAADAAKQGVRWE